MTSSSAIPASAETVSILETMRLENGGLKRLERHLARARAAAATFDYPWREQTIRAALAAACHSPGAGVFRVRLLIDANGDPTVTSTPHHDRDMVWHVAFANLPVDDTDRRLFTKTTAREPYDVARRSRPDVDDVVLWNARNEVTESTIANVVAEIDGVKCTPPVACGLLAGVLRGELLDSGALQERVISRGALARASQVWLINSLRGWIPALLVR